MYDKLRVPLDGSSIRVPLDGSTILVPLDGSATAEKVLPCARYLAAKFTAPVELLSVIDVADIAANLDNEKGRFFDAMLEQTVRQLTGYLRGIASTFPGGAVRCSVEKGKPADIIIEKTAAEKKLLITMASHGRSGLNRFLLGSVAEKVLRGSANPLLLIRAGAAAKATGTAVFRSILVPLDGSALAESVLPRAAEMARRLDVEVELFRAYHIPYNVYGDESGSFESIEQLPAALRAETEDYLEKKSAELRVLGAPRVTWVAREGLAGDEIIRLGRNTKDSLIAMSSHGRSGVKRWLLGSVAEAVARHSGDPVLIFRAA